MTAQLSAISSKTPVVSEGPTFAAAFCLAVAGVFSVPLLGAAANNILFGLAIIMLLFTSQIRSYRALLSTNITALVGTLLFIYLALSMSWAEADLNLSLKILGKFREFLLIPLFMIFFATDKYRKFAFYTLYFSLALSLFASYLIHYDLADISDNEHSLGNRIFHGVTMAFFAYMNLQLALRSDRSRYLFASVFLIVLYNLFFIENGRTGYLLIISLSALFFWQRWGLRGFIVACLIAAFAAAITLSIVDLSDLRILTKDKSLLTGDSLLSLNNLQRADARAEFYILSIMLFMQDWLIGTGLGDLRADYTTLHTSMETYFRSTGNPHNEFLNIGVQTGIPGLMLFSAFLVSLLMKRGQQAIPQQREFQAAVLITVLISCLFNSSFMDHGDGALFMILIALFCGSPWSAPLFQTANDKSGPGQSV